MKILEDFILAHPSLMHTNLFRYPVVIVFLAFAFAALCMAFSKGEMQKDAPWSSADGKSLRISFIVLACFLVFFAYDQWQYPGRKDFSNPVLAYSLGLLWISLFGLAFFFKFKKSKQNGWPEFKAAFPKLKTKRDFIIHFTSGFFVIPFLGMGVLMSGLLGMWLTGAKMSDKVSIWDSLLFIGLMPFGVFGGALIGNIAWMFILGRFASMDEMKRWAEYDTTYIPLFTPASRAINEFFIRKRAQRE